MKDLSALKHRLQEERPEDWEHLPNIELYKDQVLNYMEQQHTLQGEDARLTGAMINNYIKSGLLPRPNGKKYRKEHLAYLTAIATLKPVLTVGQSSALLRAQPNIVEPEDFYQGYMNMLDHALSATAERLDGIASEEELAAMALQMAVNSYAQKLACEKILKMLEEEGPYRK